MNAQSGISTPSANERLPANERLRPAERLADRVPGFVGDAVRGLAVHVGARVASLAGPGQVFATATVKDLVAGSGLIFEDRGEHGLKGIPDRWRLYEVASEPSVEPPLPG
jgi:class 3 adenylate cyclase